MGKLFTQAGKGLALGIGLASEGMKSRREHKMLQQAHQSNGAALSHDRNEFTARSSNGHSDYSSADQRHVSTSTDRAWKAQDQEHSQDSKSSEKAIYAVTECSDRTSTNDSNLGTRKEDSMMTTGEEARLDDFTPLSHPVVIPQRRPGNRSRGFVRAYAPDLEGCGVTQTTFLNFLEEFEKSSQANPWILSINLAGVAMNFVPIPSLVASMVGTAIHVSSLAAMELQGRYKTNKYLDHINTTFFRPHGLFCLVMTYDSSNSGSLAEVVNVDTWAKTKITSATASSTNPNQSKNASTFRSSNGNDLGGLNNMQTASLIYPKLDTTTTSDGQPQKWKFKSFAADFMDRRAQANFATENTDTILSQGPAPKFNSRYADPNGAASKGDLLALVTGGAMSRSTESRDSSPGSENDKKKHGKDRDHDRDRHHDKNRRKEERHGHRQDRRDNAPMLPMPYGRQINNPPMPSSGWSHNLDPYSMQHGYLPPPPYGMYPPPIQQDAYNHNDARSLGAGDPRLPQPHAPYSGSQSPAWPQDYWSQQQFMQQQKLQQQQQQEEEHHSSDETAKKAEDFHSPMSMAKRLVKQNVLYLMIVNMPSEEEMAEAAKLLDTQTHV